MKEKTGRNLKNIRSTIKLKLELSFECKINEENCKLKLQHS